MDVIFIFGWLNDICVWPTALTLSLDTVSKINKKLLYSWGSSLALSALSPLASESLQKCLLKSSPTSLQSEFPHRILLQALVDYFSSFPDDNYSFGWLHAWSLCLPSRDWKSFPSPCGSTGPHCQQYTPSVFSLSFLFLNSTSAFFLHHHFSQCGLRISLFWAHHRHVSEQ